ncbi:hypothetical protein [Ferroplasma sp.]|uniref:hypothetical protein n=1 Tax=Ferroplasma sp. TaxID=2591003 RepID=UPI002636DCA6|nr:hypothetical protein [Ferroplasma sp.]
MLASICEFLEPEYHEKEIEGVIEISEAISRLTKSLIQKAPEAFKSKLIENILEEILKDPELLNKFRNEIKGK